MTKLGGVRAGDLKYKITISGLMIINIFLEILNSYIAITFE